MDDGESLQKLSGFSPYRPQRLVDFPTQIAHVSSDEEALVGDRFRPVGLCSADGEVIAGEGSPIIAEKVIACDGSSRVVENNRRRRNRRIRELPNAFLFISRKQSHQQSYSRRR